MPKPENTFNFGTGSIDKDQWQRDIDNEQDAFISRYTNATSKKSGLLLRQAFQDLRRRIASGDMLNRTADGLYQFGSALNRDDKGMQEAYQRALGFMGDLARRLIQAPPPEPEKKAIGNLEERYIRSLNPSGKFNTDAYWKNQTDDERRESLKSFLNDELKNINNYNDFGNFNDIENYKNRLNRVLNLLESKTANDWSLLQLGFTKNWLQQPADELEEELTKSRLEQAQENYQAAVADQQAALLELQTAALTAPSPQFTSLLSFDPTQYWTYDSYIRGRDKAIEALKYTDENGNQFLKSGVTISRVPGGNGRFTEQRTTRNTAWNGQAAKDARTYAQRQYINGIGNDLSNYFKNLGVNYQSYLGNNTSKNNLMTNLSKLFTLDTEGNFVLLDIISKLFAKLEDGKYGLRGSTLSYDPASHTLYNGSNIDTYGEGGVIKGQNGLLVDDSYYVTPSKPSKEQKTETTPDESKQQFSTAENARIAATIADIASMGAAFVPGYGTAASAILGLGSTATNFGADLADGQGLWDATKNAGFGLAADVMGLIPGLGGVGKGAKIARNLMWAVPKMMQWVNTANGLYNAGEIKNSIVKLTSPSSMTVQDWLNVSQALQIMTGHGRSVATRVKKAGMSKKTTTTDPEYYIFTNKGKQRVSDETFKRLREARGVKTRQALTLELMGEGVTLQQTRFAPWNTSTRFGAFKEVPGKTKVEVQNKHKGWFSDENLVERVENANPSVDIRSIMHKVNPYRGYYNRRNQSVTPQRNYSDFEARLNGEASPLNVRGPLQPYPTGETYITPKTKRKPLTDQQKAARKQKAADKKSKEQAKKQLEELRRNQGYALAEEIPQAGTYADIRSRQQDVINLSNKYANEVELPIPTPRPAPGPRSKAFNQKYGKAIGKKEIGGILRALRNGGIIKAQWGDNTSDWDPDILKKPELKPYTNPYFPDIEYKGTPPWFKSRFSGEIVNNLGEDLHNRGNLPGGMTGNNLDYAFGKNQAYVKSGQKNKEADILGYFDSLPSPVDAKDIKGLTDIYNSAIDELYLPFTSGKDLPDYIKSDASKHNLLFRQVYGSRAKSNESDNDYDIGWNPDIIKTFGSASFARRPVNYETKFEDDLKNNLTLARDRVYTINHHGISGKVYVDENGRIHPLTSEQLSIIEGKPQRAVTSIADTETGINTPYNTNFKNPNDPTPWLIAGKTALGIAGNRNIYKNLLEEMPQAPLRDPLNRQLAIVGWLERIKEGQNQLADLRNATWMLHGSDLLANFAKMLETERVGRGITDTAFREDSGRQFETAGKLWNLKNEDVLYNTKVGDDNRKAIADRARMMAQIRAAWRSGDNNILMGALADTSNWLMKKYQREQDLVDKTKELALGTPEEQAQASLQNDAEYSRIMNKHVAGLTLTDEEKAYVRRKQAEALRDIRGKFAQSYYGTYHSPWFGGGYREQILKNGGSLEKEKLRARGKDNDRYVSMMKDIRKTSYRRRRR